jgi:head-tail adaptor
MDSTARSRSARYVFIAILALLAMLVGFTGDKILPITVDDDPVVNTATTPAPTKSSKPEPKATKDPLASDPAPPLLDAGDLRTVGTVIDGQKAPSNKLIKRWWSENGTGKADEGFVSWAAAQLPAEPTTIQRQTEKATVKQLKSSRDPAGNRAAEWLNNHGCEDVWASFTAQQLSLRSTTDDEPSDSEIKTVLKLASEVASAAQDRTGSPAASQPKPCSGATKPARSDCSCNYPSTQATMSAAARTYLGKLSPYRFDQYAWMEQQVDLAAVYAGLELPSDVGSGALLGDLVGQYVLVTRGHAKP